MQIKLFGISREIVGSNTLTVNENIETVAALKAWLNEQYPAMQWLKSFAVAVDSAYADDEQKLSEQNEVAIIPPVSGG